MTYAGRLVGLEPPTPSRNVRLVPYALGSMGRAPGAVGTTSEGRPGATSTLGRVGGDAKWAVTPSAALDLTVNTDFAQTDVDRQVVNLSRFSVFFPERRQFFLENAGLFSPGLAENGEPFFSRAIGLDALGRPVPLDGGARGTWRSSPGSAGALVVRQRGVGGPMPGPERGSGAVPGEPGSTFGVLRGQRNVGARHRVGVMAVTRLDDGGAGRAPAANTVALVDGLYRPSEEVSVRGMYARSTTTGAGGAGGEGTFAFVEGWRQTNRMEVGWTQAFIGPGYTARAGFTPRTNLVASNPWLDLDLRPRWLPGAVRRLTPYAWGVTYHGAADRRLQEAVWSAAPLAVELQSGAVLATAWRGNVQVLTAPFEPIPGARAAAGRYRFDQLVATAATDPSSPIAAQVEMVRGGWYDGRIAQLDGRVRVTPLPHVSAAVRVLDTRLAGVGARTVSGPAVVRERLVVPELRLALDPRVQLTGIYQHNTAAGQGAWNARFAWEYRPLSYLFVVWNGARALGDAVRAPGAPPIPGGQLVVKLVHVGQW
jgi:hypothetical protein